ncbi:ABC transporter permease subunit [Pseudalkalibacillus berkeleyi]|uniref:ABC transporter permease subunit n=1 Tax=Pseudalkalibacillus berkeleyi TaxID=1069813 RepID=A0ABS9H3G9_9BACL|nr:ABC transporter permease subunit [Pseudalkalibacillus berkeleyi]MCF6138626.1 ABC transporter permease subunit [Pseudalkalibacillus berkeleyi]
MTWNILKQPQFMIGTLIILSLLGLSFGFDQLFKMPEQVKYLYKNGSLVGVAPFTPSEVPPFGTDKFGRSLFHMIIKGAKYTLVIAFGIALIRVFLALMLSMVYHRFYKKLSAFFKDIIESTIFIPSSILAFLLLAPLTVHQVQEGKSIAEILTIQCIILVLIGVPQLISTFSNDMMKISEKEYIVSTHSLGAKPIYVYFKHIIPEMATRVLLVITQQIIQVLILLAHLGVLLIFLGGRSTFTVGDIFNEHEVFTSQTGEWAGLIGHNFNEIMLKPHVLLIPLAFFSLTIFALNLVINGIQNHIKPLIRGGGRR